MTKEVVCSNCGSKVRLGPTMMKNIFMGVCPGCGDQHTLALIDDESLQKDIKNTDDKNLWYFAYGSNLNKPQLEERIGKWKESKKAFLEGYKLTFDAFSTRWECGAADIVESPGNKVFGAVYMISEGQLKILDRYEGAPIFYKRVNVIVNCDDKKIEAITYVVVNKRGFIKPSDSYLDTVVEGLRQHGYEEDVIEIVEKEAGR